ncbi:MAG: hypothetical protein LBT79_03600 [Elusimicrobiota bacterium]|jgi:hypothetical protein|nr:hypothetical protein [Elusimicrobiota bacterium]
MATDKIYKDEDIIEANGLYEPQYHPFFLLLKEGKVYDEKIGNITFKRRGLVGDKKAASIIAQDTEIKHVSVGEKAPKRYMKMVRGSEYAVSGLQDNGDASSVDAEVLDAFNKQLDFEIFAGEGTDNASVKNNGIFFSQDSNFIDKGDVKPFPSDVDGAKLFVKNLAIESADNSGGGLKRIVLLGSRLPGIFDKLVPGTSDNLASVINKNTLSGQPPIEILVVPREINEAIGNIDAILCIDYENVVLNRGLLPQIWKKGFDDRANENWTQYLYNSAMVDVVKKAALIKQLVSIAA